MTIVLSGNPATPNEPERRARPLTILPKTGIDFTSNDFLALANSPRLKAAIVAAMERGIPVGSGASRSLRGNHPEHVTLEEEAAEFFGSDRAVFFESDFAASFAVFSTLPQWGDVILHDKLINPSVYQGILGSKAEKICVPHNDISFFEQLIREWRGAGGRGRPWIVVESLYSMDGDKAPLRELAELSDRYDGFLVVDEAHATGVCDAGGKGLASELQSKENFIALHSCGKALGVSGALLTVPTTLGNQLVNRARSLIYSSSPSPLVAAAVREALRILQDEPDRRDVLKRLVERVGERLKTEFNVEPSGSHIQPIVLGGNSRALLVSDALQTNGFDVRAIRAPNVPDGTARLRLSITLNVGEDEISAMLNCLAFALEDHPA